MRTKILVLITLFSAQALAADALVFKSKGRAPSRQLKIKSSKVPTFEMHKAKEIPRLDIGEEAVVESSDYKVELEAKTLSLKPTEKQVSPKTPDFDPKKNGPLPWTQAKAVTVPKNLSQIPEVKELRVVEEPTLTPSEPQTQALINMKEADFKLLEALIYLDEHKNYEQALALLAEIMMSNDYKYESLFIYALTAQALQLNSEFRYNMFRVAKESKDKALQEEAVRSLVSFVESLDVSDIKDLEPLVAKFELDTTENDSYNYFRAKYFLDEGVLGQVEDALLFVPERSKHYGDALLISAIYNYRRGKVDESIRDLERLNKIMDKFDRLQGIAALTLARNFFQKGMYKEANEAYLKVNKADPLFLQAMVEQSWTQILLGDFEGAAGNMFTLHTDFFKNAFAPESYVVRTVGYLNLCQFGDGMQVLNNLNKKYGPYKERLEGYQSSRKNNTAFYETVRNWLKDSDQREVDGLPRSFIVELARHPSFMKIQTQINNFEDELEGFNKATLSIIQKEKNLIKRQSDAKEEMAKLNKLASESKITTTQLKIDLAQQERRLLAYKMQYQLTNRARSLIKSLREKAIVRVDKEKVELKDLAGRALKNRFTTIIADLKRILDQNDVLQYELFSGAGEHMRYEMAGGNTKDGKDGKKVDEKKVSWKFKGEIWEDEVGHVRSSLENICPKEDSVASK